MLTIPQFLDEAGKLQKASMKTTIKKKVKRLNEKENRHPVKHRNGKGNRQPVKRRNGKGNRHPVVKPKRK